MAENGQIIVVKRKKKGGHGGHHGGAWKVAYADFVTAMMAFFLLLWLLAAANKSQLEGISAYFKNPSGVPAAGGASTSVIQIGSNVDVSKGEGEKEKQSDNDEVYSESFKKEEIKQLEEMKEAIQESMESSETLKEFKDQVQVKITPEGLVIQILDKENRPMFDLGSAILRPYAQKILRAIAPTLESTPNRISVAGHTDVLGYVAKHEYSNWELSVDRANAARRELLVAKMKEEKVARVVGHGSAVPFDTKNPANPANRRITIVVLKKQADDAMFKGEGLEAAKPSFNPFAIGVGGAPAMLVPKGVERPELDKAAAPIAEKVLVPVDKIEEALQQSTGAPVPPPAQAAAPQEAVAPPVAAAAAPVAPAPAAAAPPAAAAASPPKNAEASSVLRFR